MITGAGLLAWGVPSGLTFDLPWVLLGLPLLLLLPRSRGWALRALTAALLLIAIAGPRAPVPGGQLALLLDVSESVGEGARQALQESGLAIPDEYVVYEFAGDAGAALGPGLRAELQPERTDLARALQVAAAADPERILLLSDGAQSHGNALLSLPPAPVDTFRVPPRENAAVLSLAGPDRAAPGETIEVLAGLHSDVATPARLVLSLDGNEIRDAEVDLPQGQSVVPFRLEAPDSSEFEVAVRVEVPFEQSRVDDRQSLQIGTAQDEPVLVIGDPGTAGLLAGQGIPVVEGEPGDVELPLEYSAIIIRGSSGAYTPGQQQLLNSYVENGGGLMMTGGPDSFGFGAWYRSDVEEVLPVDSDLRTEVEIPLVAMVIVLDRSQSMASGNPSKLELAREGALGVIELAYHEDLLGLIVFSDSYEWAFNLRKATSQGKREMLAAVLNVTTSGGTILEPAYQAAIDELNATDAAIKHVIILSDGRLYDGQSPFGGGAPPDFTAMAQAAADEGITTSAIAIGAGADVPTLSRIASAGEGRFHNALDVNTLPRIFTSEALTATRSLLREGPVTPLAHPHPLLSAPGQLQGALDAYVVTTLKPTGQLLLSGVDGEPVLATQRHGLGRTAAFTSDLNGWAGGLAASPELAGLITGVVRWLRVTPATFSAWSERDGNELRVVVDAVEDGEYVNSAQLEVRHAGTRAQMEQIAPGRYEAVVPLGDPGDPVLVVQGGEVVARTAANVVTPEFDQQGAPELLRQISLRSGGENLATLEGYAPELTRQGVPLWPWLLAGALLLFLVELLLRRFVHRGFRNLAK